MRVMDLTERIEKEIPREQALDWDNVGLLVGDVMGLGSSVAFAGNMVSDVEIVVMGTASRANRNAHF